MTVNWVGGRTGARRVVFGAAISAVVLLCAAVWWLAGRDDPHGDPRLYETAWALESASVDGRPVDVRPTGRPSVWSFAVFMNDGDPSFEDTPVINIDHGCDRGTIEVDLDGRRGRWTAGLGYTPVRSCVDGMKDAMNALLFARTFTYDIEDGRLVIASVDGRADFELLSVPRTSPDRG